MLQCLAGPFIVIFYAMDLLSAVLPPAMDAQLVAILTAAVRLVMSAVGSALLQTVGRRPVALASALGSAATTALVRSRSRPPSCSRAWSDARLPTSQASAGRA